jgi:hypothetical protein
MAVLAAERVERPAGLFGSAPARRPAATTAAPRERRETSLGGGPTLDEAIVGAWEGLAAQLAVACPLCGGALRPRTAGRAEPAGGRCADCGTTLD